MATVPLQKPPAPVSEETLESRFHRLADIWHAAVAHHSSSSIRNLMSSSKRLVRSPKMRQMPNS